MKEEKLYNLRVEMKSHYNKLHVDNITKFHNVWTPVSHLCGPGVNFSSDTKP
jgi:hypothetical protein